MVVTALVAISGVKKDWGALAALVNNEVQGVQATAKLPPFDAYAGQAIYLLNSPRPWSLPSWLVFMSRALISCSCSRAHFVCPVCYVPDPCRHVIGNS